MDYKQLLKEQKLQTIGQFVELEEQNVLSANLSQRIDVQTKYELKPMGLKEGSEVIASFTVALGDREKAIEGEMNCEGRIRKSRCGTYYVESIEEIEKAIWVEKAIEKGKTVKYWLFVKEKGYSNLSRICEVKIPVPT